MILAEDDAQAAGHGSVPVIRPIGLRERLLLQQRLVL